MSLVCLSSVVVLSKDSLLAIKYWAHVLGWIQDLEYISG
jgi:hypothetical protein